MDQGRLHGGMDRSHARRERGEGTDVEPVKKVNPVMLSGYDQKDGDQRRVEGNTKVIYCFTKKFYGKPSVVVGLKLEKVPSDIGSLL